MIMISIHLRDSSVVQFELLNRMSVEPMETVLLIEWPEMDVELVDSKDVLM